MENPIKFKIQLGDKFSKVYVLVETNAPDRYDYADVIPVYTYGPQRWVLIPEDSVEYQCARYRSGMHSANPCGEDGLPGPIDLIEILYKRLRGTV